MRRTVLVIPALLAALALAGCGDKEVQNASGEPTGTPSASSTAPAPSATGPRISEQEFCDNIVAVFSSGGAESGSDPFVDLLSDGMPAEMSAEATAGVQVLIDNAGKLEDPKAIFDVYQGLSEQDQHSVEALGTYIATACGEQMFKGLVGMLPTEVPEGLKSLSPEDLPSELRELLPSELPSELRGIIPEELATLIPEEWRDLIPDEYREIFESPGPSATPTV